MSWNLALWDYSSPVPEAPPQGLVHLGSLGSSSLRRWRRMQTQELGWFAHVLAGWLHSPSPAFLITEPHVQTPTLGWGMLQFVFNFFPCQGTPYASPSESGSESLPHEWYFKSFLPHGIKAPAPSACFLAPIPAHLQHSQPFPFVFLYYTESGKILILL